jgi:hypothetical protein
MRDALGSGTTLGYCTNVHAGATWEQTRENLLRHAPAVRELVSHDEPMGVGLWFSGTAAREIVAGEGIATLRALLDENGLLAYTLNGFPHGDFHKPVVKHDVYEPDWSDARRLEYTRDLVEILDGLLPPGAAGSISTLPVGWSTIGDDPGRLERACDNLLAITAGLRDLESARGRLIHLDLEPEPGCHLQRSEDVVTLFGQLRSRADLDVTRYLRVCHDVCHAAVMFEAQREVFRVYDDAGIAVGKVQLSSAVRACFADLDPGTRRDAAAQLAAFDERRYLHQTAVRDAGGTTFHDDLPEALSRHPEPSGEWRVHFHVPLHVGRFGHLQTTQPAIGECLDLLRGRVEHWEVETYAWEVLPDAMRTGTLAEGIARELAWVRDKASAPAPKT